MSLIQVLSVANIMIISMAKVILPMFVGVMMYVVLGVFTLTPKLVRANNFGYIMRRVIDIAVPAVTSLNTSTRIEEAKKKVHVELHDVEDWCGDECTSDDEYHDSVDSDDEPRRSVDDFDDSDDEPRRSVDDLSVGEL